MPTFYGLPRVLCLAGMLLMAIPRAAAEYEAPHGPTIAALQDRIEQAKEFSATHRTSLWGCAAALLVIAYLPRAIVRG